MERQKNTEQELYIKINKAIEWAKNRQSVLMQQVLAIEKVLNQIKDTKPIIKPK